MAASFAMLKRLLVRTTRESICDSVLQRFGWNVVLLFLFSIQVGYSDKLPRNPILENSQAHLESVEKRLEAKEQTHADHLELGIARYRVWRIYLARSRFPATNGKARREAARNLRQADRLKPDVIRAFEEAMTDPADPQVAAHAKVMLSVVYSEMQDWDNHIAMLQSILRDHADLNHPAVFGVGGTPQYYCWYTLAGAYQQKGNRTKAVEALSRAALAIAAMQTSSGQIGDVSGMILGRLLTYEPRIVLPAYQRQLPSGMQEILNAHRTTAPVRIRLSVKRADHDAAVVAYQVVFPEYPEIIKTWEEAQTTPRVPLPDDFSHLKPAFHLSFTVLPTTEGFENRNDIPVALAQPLSAELTFDDQATSTGEITLRWAESPVPQQDVYLSATLVQTYIRGGTSIPAQNVYVKPVRVGRHGGGRSISDVKAP